MNNDWGLENLFLGSGGRAPGLDRFFIESGRVERLITLPEGGGIYAIDDLPDGEGLAMGTRTGLVYWMVPSENKKGDSSLPFRKLIQGAPVLSVCFLDVRHLAVSDTAGRCLIWERENDHPPRPLWSPSDKSPLCSLLKLEDHLVCLSAAGELFIRHLPDGKLLFTQPGPLPPALWSLVGIYYWPEAHALVRPGKRGELVIYDLSQEKSHIHTGHEGEFYGMAILDGRLMTAGKEDGRLCCWSSDLNKTPITYPIPQGTVSTAAWTDQGCHLILVNQTGQAGHYRFDDAGQLRLVDLLPGDQYRVVHGPDPAARKAFKLRQANQEARLIAGRIEEQMKRGASGELEGLHRRLIELGYRPLSLSLRGKYARGRNDLIGELKAYHELATIVSPKDPGALASLITYADLLEKIWKLGEAREQYRQILKNHPGADTAQAISRIERKIEKIHHSLAIIDPGIPIPVLIEAVAVVQRPFFGRYVIRALDPMPCSGITISSEDFVKNYRQFRQRESEHDLPCANQEVVPWLSTNGLEEIPIVILTSEKNSFFPGLHFGLKFLQVGLQSVVTPVVLFAIKKPPSGKSADEHNREVLQAWQRIEDRTSANAWLERVHQAAVRVLNMLLTQTLSQKIHPA